ncbi:MAG: hypothetical protein PHU31_07480 [Anaerotignum sp.]|nr:hypothetical protein [Anaerotignum sp.]
MDSDVLKSAGIDFEKGIARFLGDRKLYESILVNFLNDTTFTLASEAFKNEKYTCLYECVHMLKGVAGNTDMTMLFRSTGALCDYLRKCEDPDREVVILLFREIEEAYYSAMLGIVAAKEA